MRNEERGTMTITLSLPKKWQGFFDGLSESGYNRSMLMLKMAKILKVLYVQQDTYPGGLPKMIDCLLEFAEQGEFLEESSG